MSCRFLLGAITVLFLSFAAEAKNEAIFFGGGGEPANKDSTIFDESYMVFAPFKAKSGWDTKSYFNGGHEKSEALAQKMSGGKNQPMTSQNMKAEIANLKERILSGDLTKGDQLMLTLATHGHKPKGNQATHSIATTDGEFDLAELIELRDLAEKNGVKLAIVDYSCYSGASLALGSDKTCVLTSASDNVAYNNSGHKMSQNMTKGKNLEDVFLYSRAANNAGTPQISTEAGRQAYQDTKLLSEMMLHDASLDENLNSTTACTTKDESQFNKLAKQLKSIEKKNRSVSLLAPLEKAKADYNKSRAYAERAFATQQNLNEKICKGSMCGTRVAWEAENSRLIDKSFDPQSLTAKEAKDFELVRSVVRTPEHMAWKNAVTHYKNESGALREHAEKVAQAERSVYQNLYEEYSKKSKKPNPCRDFKL